ncbi:hypothetical protein [Dokdonia sp. Asnod3-C12]|jgi:hypothetical protein|uniref:hypothetical protein n=1 Tax=Dokdonia sp. Asnod3-C12 TaxID=3160575 RepID=UPI0030EBB2DB|tara:strand:- start:47649 stop:48059 length:411 start_codon:yes stop_codon:yes gene_type:complete
MDDLLQKKDLNFAIIEFYKTYVVCKMNEGIVLDVPKAIALHEQSRPFYNGLKYGFIFDRTIDYTIDPIVYIQCPYYADINAMFVVAQKFNTKQIVQFEQNFSKYKLTVFDTLKEAQKEIKKVKFGEKSPLTEEPLR